MKAGPEQEKLWDAFIAEWPIERLRKMTLTEYASVGDDKSFIRWIESRLSEMGSIWGGSAFKFGIYRRSSERERSSGSGRSYSDEYAWYSKYGETAEQAFAKVRELVAATASAAREGNLDAIDIIDLGDAFKWKIAFHYQDRVAPVIAPVFSRQHLQAFLGEKPSAGLPYSGLYRRINQSRAAEDVLVFGIKLWETASKKLAEVFNPDSAEVFLESRYRYFGKPTQNLAGFVTPSGRSIALRRGRTVVRAFVEPDAPVPEGVTIAETYGADSPRSSNLPSQAPSLGLGQEAKLIQFNSAEALAAFCDAYDDAPIDVQSVQPLGVKSEVLAVDSLNVILYGPPGTGKTYKTAEMAVEICDGQADGDRAALMKRYEELRNDGRIRFATFHQSYSYEDFVEGLRPELADGVVTYRVRPGLFREACDAARRSRLVQPGLKGRSLGERTFYKMSLGSAGTPEGEKVFQESIERGYVTLGWGENVDFSLSSSIDDVRNRLREERPEIADDDSQARFPWLLKHEVKVGDIVIVSHGNRAFRAIGEITGEYEFLEEGTFHQARPVRWLAVFEGKRNVSEIYDRAFMQSSLYKIDREGLKLEAIEALLRSGQVGANQPFVLIIDEINRANISKVIGELITLIEPDKREGAQNALTVKLPYSGEDFSVPANLYILGTMNTADRSIALLDTALRRRFDFVELRPDERTLGGAVVEGIDLASMLMALNRRVEYLYDRDHAIGHAYFMNVLNLADLETVMRRKVIPLLQEYFYEDWSKVRLALNDHAGHFVEQTIVKLSSSLMSDDQHEPKPRFTVREEPFPVQAYLSIYS